MENYNLNEQLLAFDRVLPWEGQVPAFVREGGNYYLQIAAPGAQSVSFLIEEKEHPCEKDEAGVWRTEYPVRKGIHLVQLLIDSVPVLTPLLPVTYGYSRPYNYVAMQMEDEEFYRIKDVPHGSVRREYFYSEVTGEWESLYGIHAVLLRRGDRENISGALPTARTRRERDRMDRFR